MSESRTQRSFKDDDAVRDDPGVVQYPHGVSSGSTEALHEGGDIGFKVIGIAALVVAGLVIVALIAVRLLTNLYYQSPQTQPQGGSAIANPTPPVAVEIRVNPLAAWQRYKAEADQKLNGYGWVDQNAGVAHIPIARAMTLFVDGVQPAVGAAPGGAAPAGTPSP